MAPIADGAGVPLRYEVHGDGPLVLLVHGLAADRHALAPVPGTRSIAYDRRGYGDSGAPEHYVGTTVEEQAEDAAALLRALDEGPAVVAGDGFGALVALDLARRHRALVRAVALADPPLFMLVPEATAALSEERGAIEEAVHARGPQAGVEVWLAGRADGHALARARTAYRGFFADYAGLASWGAGRAELRRLDAPTAIVTTPAAPPHVVAASDALARLLPQATRDAGGDLTTAAAGLLGR